MEGKLQVILGQNLQRLRKARGLSQEEMANELGFHRTYMGSVERGERNLSLKSVETLANLLGVEPLDLLDTSIDS